ncbi:GNAT family N-acetyltransferase [Maritimibacter sp. UBA3975]|uniref:GNAT family N-acetyltransferase n=1 Tax=Maritimibacter sp. UBA3975 TaxID=1946833 RepID=UPI000C0ADB6E|nr:GNAT family N-acetyltransferase [Maritimibacter sp. UBA3975]MAM63095.1 GNAT family N-acetyltransferase [Maritimibacter sp.]
MNAVRITRARVWDAPALSRILWEFGDESPWLPRARTRREDMRTLRGLIARGWVRVARRGPKVVGFIAVGEGEVHGLYLTTGARGQGVGRALIARAQSDSARLGLWAHAANHPARRFYAATGFRPVAVGANNDERLTEVRYEWEKAV